MFIADPNIEIILLGIQIGLKTTLTELISIFLGRNPLKDLREKFNYLADRVYEDSVSEHAGYLLGNDYSWQFGTKITQQDIQKWEVLLLIKAIINIFLAQHRRYDQVMVMST